MSGISENLKFQNIGYSKYKNKNLIDKEPSFIKINNSKEYDTLVEEYSPERKELDQEEVS